jgi:hypothetical protein
MLSKIKVILLYLAGSTVDAGDDKNVGPHFWKARTKLPRSDQPTKKRLKLILENFYFVALGLTQYFCQILSCTPD